MTLRAFDSIEAERLQRARSCFEADRPTRGEVVRSMRRWEFSRERHTRIVPARAAWMFATITLLTGATLAATGALKLPAWATLVAATAQPTASSAPQRAPTPRPPNAAKSGIVDSTSVVSNLHAHKSSLVAVISLMHRCNT